VMPKKQVQLMSNDAERGTMSWVLVPTLRHYVVPAQSHYRLT